MLFYTPNYYGRMQKILHVCYRIVIVIKELGGIHKLTNLKFMIRKLWKTKN